MTFFQRRHTDGQQVNEKVLNITSHQGSANQNYNEISPCTTEWLKDKKIRVGKDVEKREPSCSVGGNVNWCSYNGKQYGGFSKN